MKLPSLWSGNRGFPGLWSSSQGLDPLWSIQRDIEEMARMFGRLPSLRSGAGTPSVSIAEDKDCVDVTVELPGVDEKDVKVSIEDNQLVVSGEKREETKRDERNWHIEERSFGSFYRSIPLPFRPDENAVEAYLEKGVLHLKVKKPTEAETAKRTIEIKSKSSEPAKSTSPAQEPRESNQTGAAAAE